jgi:hypothetical protein
VGKETMVCACVYTAYAHTVEYYSALEKENLPFVTIWSYFRTRYLKTVLPEDRRMEEKGLCELLFRPSSDQNIVKDCTFIHSFSKHVLGTHLWQVWEFWGP